MLATTEIVPVIITMLFLASRMLTWSWRGLRRYQSSVVMSEALTKLASAPEFSTTEYRFKACRIGLDYASIL